MEERLCTRCLGRSRGDGVGPGLGYWLLFVAIVVLETLASFADIPALEALPGRTALWTVALGQLVIASLVRRRRVCHHCGSEDMVPTTSERAKRLTEGT